MWLRSSSVSLDGYGFKIRKVSRWRSAASNETILATRQEVFFTKLTSADQGNLLTRAKHNLHCIIVILINAGLLNFYFILHCYLFFGKEIYFFECLYFSEYDIRVSLYVFFWLKKGTSIKDVRNCWVMGVYPKCVQLRTGGGGNYGKHRRRVKFLGRSQVS